LLNRWNRRTAQSLKIEEFPSSSSWISW